MPNLTLIEEDDTESVNMQDKMCKICKTNPWKYTCPRCNVTYCTVACYQSETHGSCSEAFYRECIMEEMGAEVGNPESERKMMEILVRMQQEPTMEQLESEDEECEPDLADRLGSVNLDDADAVWEKLTDAERQEFEQLLQSGDASDLLPPWTPWWDYKVEKRLVVDMDEKVEEEKSYVKNCPSLKKNVKPLTQITKAAPSPMVRTGCVNAVAAYTVAARWFNGEHRDFGAEAASAVAALSAFLADGNNFQTVELALADVAHRALDCPWLGFTADSRLTMHSDVRALLSGPEPSNAGFYLSACLSDLRTLFSASRKATSVRPVDEATGSSDAAKARVDPAGLGPLPDSSGEFSKRFGPTVGLPSLPLDKAKACARKLDYLMSWALKGYTEICGQGILDGLE